MKTSDYIHQGNSVLGIEFGSTRIKSVLIDEKGNILSQGSFEWENDYINGIWTYSKENIIKGLQESYRDLKQNVYSEYKVNITKIASIGISAMMHGYIVLDEKDELLVPFRTWRNTITQEASLKLTKLFSYNIPQRWSIAHLYQAMLNEEEHVKDIHFITTLAGYVHYLLTDCKVIGIGDASGMFPIDSNIKNYNPVMLEKFETINSNAWKLENILPEIIPVGQCAGKLSQTGSLLLDPSGDLEINIPLCPPEGDAQTGMVATNSIKKKTGNVSAGTSIFSMVVLEEELKNVYSQIDVVTTPLGDPVAMVHCNNGTSDLNAWVNLFYEFAGMLKVDISKNELYELLYKEALNADIDCGGLMSYGFYAGEPVLGLNEGNPLFIRTPESKLTISNFMRSHLMNVLGAIRIGNEILWKENVQIDSITGHGGFFKTELVGQSILAACMKAPVTVMETAGEGGAWGIALLASYLLNNKNSLYDYLDGNIFKYSKQNTYTPSQKDIESFDIFMNRFNEKLHIEKEAVC